jgi:hypothetical protein
VHPLGRPPPVSKSPKLLRRPPKVEHLAANGRANDGHNAAPATRPEAPAPSSGALHPLGPDAELSGTLAGTFVMDGDLVGNVALNLVFTGQTEAGPGGEIVRVPGTVQVTGTATSDYGVFAIDVAL